MFIFIWTCHIHSDFSLILSVCWISLITRKLIRGVRDIRYKKNEF